MRVIVVNICGMCYLGLKKHTTHKNLFSNYCIQNYLKQFGENQITKVAHFT